MCHKMLQRDASVANLLQVALLTPCTAAVLFVRKYEELKRSAVSLVSVQLLLPNGSNFREQDRSSRVEESDGLAFDLGTRRSSLRFDRASA
jgi:hypothetical protein